MDSVGVALADEGSRSPPAAATMTLPARLQPIASERRRDGRRPIVAEGGIIASGDGIHVTILDLSETGFRAIPSRNLGIGDWVRLTLDGGGGEPMAAEAQVRWRRRAEYGFSFAFALPAEFVAAALANAEVAPAPALESPDIVMSWADYRARRCLFADRVVPLTPLMAEILSVLLIRRGEAVTGVELARAVWSDEQITSNRMATLHVIIVRLRERLPNLLVSPSRGSYMVPLPGA